MVVQDLRCEYQADPLGIDNPAPRFSWKLLSDRRGVVQTSYRILVASSPENLQADRGDKWDSGLVESDRSVNVVYDGTQLASGEKCWWKVRVTGTNGGGGDWSEPATFEMGLLEPGDWGGSWIAANASVSSPMMRTAFDLNAEIVRARLYVCGIGWHEVYLNGNKVSDRLMDPAPTYYANIQDVPVRTRASYVTHDVTGLLARGENALGAWLGHGWYSSDTPAVVGRQPYGDRPILRAQLVVDLADGSRLCIATDDKWRVAASPITANEMCQGESYDARLEQDGWDAPGFDAAGWARAQVVEGPSEILSAMAVEPVRIAQRYRPKRVHKTDRGTCVFDMGQYISGFTEMRVSGPAGATITMAHAGRFCYETDSLDARNAGDAVGPHAAAQTDRYTLKGVGEETYRPRFTLHGFRYVEVIGWPGEPTIDDITGCAVNNDIAAAGKFECSRELLNRIHHNVWHTFRGSFQGIPQDASDRAERFGWLGDPGYVAEDHMLNFADVRFWSKWLDDIADVQRPNGMVPFAAPPSWPSCYCDWPCWENSYILIAWLVSFYNDDPQVLARHYEGLKKQVERFRGLAKDHILPESLGDHMEPRDDVTSSFIPMRTPAELTGTAYHSRCARLLSQAAELLGKDDDAAVYARLADEIKDAFNAKYFDAEAGHYGEDSQTANALALYLDLVPCARRQDVLDHLVKIVEKRGGHLNTGIIGTDALEQALGANGRAGVMLTIASQTTFPGWGYGVTIGQTTIGEDFECSPRHSLSMKMLGSVEKFFYRDVAGIEPVAPGYKSVVVEPKVTGELDWARAAIETCRGTVGVDWRKTPEGLTLNVVVPANSVATVNVPVADAKAAAITEGGKAVWDNGSFVVGVEGVTSGRAGEHVVTLEVGSGHYEFRSTRAAATLCENVQ